MVKRRIPLTVIVGPTASGKSSLALELARETGAHIVSCDSMQIYRGMDIGTAKPTPAERAAVPHHMIDVADPGDDYTLSDFVEAASREIAEIDAAGAPVILCGGTGLYVSTLLRGGSLAPDVPDSAYDGLDALDNGRLHDELRAVDPDAADAIHPNNRRRVERALAIFRGTGVTKTEWDARSRLGAPPYDPVIIGLDYRDRAALYGRIDRRVDEMFECGLVDEVRRVMPRRDSTAGQAIGYKELLDAFDGLCTLDEARERIKQATRNYAKRQLTWFRRDPDVSWIYPDECADPVAEAKKLVADARA